MADSTRVEELRKRYHENPRRFFAPLANEYRKGGFLDRALLLCQKHLGEQPENMNGLIVYGQTLFESGQHAEARVPFAAALELDPENLIALRHLGDIARLGGDNADARRWYERVLEYDRRNEEVQALLDEVGGPTTAPPKKADEPVFLDMGESQSRPSTHDGRTVEMTPPSVASAKTVEVSARPRTLPKAQHRASLLDINFDFSDMPVEAPSVPKSPDIAPMAGLELAEFSTEVTPLSDFEPMEFEVGNAFGDAMDLIGAAASEPAIVTETMAELYLEQGFTGEAIEVYRKLVAQDPTDEELQAKLASLAQQTAARDSMGFEIPAEGTAETIEYPPANAMLSEVSFDDLALSTPPARASMAAPVAAAAAPAAPMVEPEPLSTGPSAREFFSAFARRAVASSEHAPDQPDAPEYEAEALAAASESWAYPASLSSLDSLFGGAVSDEDQRAANFLAGIAPTSAPTGGSAFDELFGGGPGSAPTRRATSARNAVPRASEKLKFDQFFTASSTPPRVDAVEPPSVELPSVERELERPSAEPGEGGEDDLDQFQGWLKGLTQ